MRGGLGEQVSWCLANLQPHVNINWIWLKELKELIMIVLWQKVEVKEGG